jgi:hypothetical protein
MKKLPIALGYFTTFFTALYAIFKFLHFKGAIILMFIAGILIAIYFSLLFLKQFQERSGKQANLIHKLGVFLFSVIILSTIFGFNHFWQISTWMFCAAYGGFSLIFIPLLIYNNSKDVKNDLLKNLVAGSGLAIISISLLGYPLHWPYHHILFIIGNVLFILIYLPWYIFANRKNQESFDFIFKTLIIAYILVLFVYGIFLDWPITNLK